MARILSELSEFQFRAKSFVLQMYDVLAKLSFAKSLRLDVHTPFLVPSNFCPVKGRIK
jgi:hypothetical protein